ncbi:ABC transporter ATP-binding protein [Rhodococcus sp. AD45-ID]|uniref:ABC transporter ATP-binding protein n=1 Tax=unclassified Rhodococcus (in: high G+C Gram-positive bacteria) TaxID=192944 RepID=UPI0005D3069F|nr:MULTISPECIES: ATP-binding cassette domain-containing protein [unclassified Rhodococcus (in: high G+C Gram-positive bacteria)]KJF21638.1 putative ABC transporter ATP-binding protein YbhF [Rhodococcus sp. AD45]PSR39094.1 ABC transporter ATP-binding protein [Rhodococcus sp. AD45-ID]
MTSSAPGRVSAPIEVRGLTKTFKAARAVNDLSFDVHAGSITGLLGPAGAGKTTTLRMLLGLVTPSDGSATINGLPISKLASPARTVGAVLDTRGLHPARTARAHLDIYAAAIGLPAPRTTQVLAVVGLSSASDRRIGLFSLGMQQRLALATALLGDPEILVLDEPTHGLDPEGTAWLQQFLTTFAESGRTVLITGQALREVEPVVDNLVLLSAGSLVYDGSVEALRASHRSRLMVSCSNPALFATALAARGITAATIAPDGRLAVSGTDSDALAPVAAASGVTIFSVVADHADLEQLFVAMTTPHYATGHPGHGPPSSHYGPPSGHYSPPSGYYGPTAYGPSGGHR